jgi:hypothetical protein
MATITLLCNIVLVSLILSVLVASVMAWIDFIVKIGSEMYEKDIDKRKRL